MNNLKNLPAFFRGLEQIEHARALIQGAVPCIQVTAPHLPGATRSLMHTFFEGFDEKLDRLYGELIYATAEAYIVFVGERIVLTTVSRLLPRMIRNFTRGAAHRSSGAYHFVLSFSGTEVSVQGEGKQEYRPLPVDGEYGESPTLYPPWIYEKVCVFSALDAAEEWASTQATSDNIRCCVGLGHPQLIDIAKL